MLPELSLLIDLQELDKEILEVSDLLERLPRQVEVRSQEIENLLMEQTVHQKGIEELNRQRRELEMEMADMEEAIKKSRQRLMDIKSNIEYRAMLKEIAFKEDQRDQRETRILELMDQLEANNQALVGFEHRREELQQSLDQLRQEVDIQVAVRQEQLAGLEQKRLVLRQELPPFLLKRYEFIRQRHNCTTVAEARHGVCLGCHLNILPQHYIDLQKGQEILQCPNCQRILYWLGKEEPEEEKPPRRASRNS